MCSQAYYDLALEPFFTTATPRLKALQATDLPAPAVGLIILGFDVVLSVGFAAYAAASIQGLVAACALATAVTAARRDRKR